MVFGRGYEAYLAYSVNFGADFITAAAWARCKRILRYLIETQTFGLTYTSDASKEVFVGFFRC